MSSGAIRPNELWDEFKARRTKLRELWDTRNSRIDAYIPAEVRGTVSEKEAIEGNLALGRQASDYVEEACSFARYFFQKGIPRFQKKVLGLGYGRGYDRFWTEYAIRCGLEPIWIDVSELSCSFAQSEFNQLLRKARKNKVDTGYLTPATMIREAEVEEALMFPENFALNLADVRIWYLCRFLNCLSQEESKKILEIIGRSLSAERDPEKGNIVIVVNAFKDFNPQIDEHPDPPIVHTTHMPRYHSVYAHLRRGSGRNLVARHIVHFRYFNKLVTAMMFMAK